MEAKNFEAVNTEASDDEEDQVEAIEAGSRWKTGAKKYFYPFIGLLSVAASAVLFTMSNVIVKWLKDVDPFTISFYRFLVIFVFSAPSTIYFKSRQNVPIFPRGRRLALVVRSILGSVNLVIHFYALKHLPLADTNLIAATAPIFTVISARVFIKEPICKLDLFNIVLVIIGITFIVKPPFIFGNYDVYKADSEMVIAIVAVILGAALLQSNVYVLLRFLKDIPVSTVLFNFGWIGSLVSGISMAALGCHCFPTTWQQWTLLITNGFISYLAQIGLTASAKFETATKVSIYRKAFDIIFAFVFQIFLFQEIPDGLKIAGAVLITAAILSSGVRTIFESRSP